MSKHDRATDGLDENTAVSSSSSGGEGTLALIILTLPVIIVSALSSWLAWGVARNGGSRSAVQICVWPGAFMVTQFVGGVVFFLGAFVIYFIFPWGAENGWIFKHLNDFALLPFFFHLYPGTRDLGYHFNYPFWQTAIYQFILWLCLGRFILREWTDSIYNGAHTA